MTGKAAFTIRAAPELAGIVRNLRKLPAHELAYAATGLLEELEGGGRLIREMRAGAIHEMRELGLTWPEVAELLGVDVGKVRGFTRSAVRPEAAAAH